jgi:hypothetical protein
MVSSNLSIGPLNETETGHVKKPKVLPTSKEEAGSNCEALNLDLQFLSTIKWDGWLCHVELTTSLNRVEESHIR